VSFFKLNSEDPLRKGMFAVQDEGSGFSVTLTHSPRPALQRTRRGCGMP